MLTGLFLLHFSLKFFCSFRVAGYTLDFYHRLNTKHRIVIIRGHNFRCKNYQVWC